VIYTQGLQNDVFKTAIVIGSLIAILIAVCFDALYLLAQRAISPWRSVRPI
jgi:ABC-type proline/glycine betaine transport system permease subunit